ncbi:MAG: glycosyltransferase family 2 protein [Nanoarchaeota archaeon]|nr:glycosyltransferase family 2 protein [Nanoarchaeota archaeon]
MDLSSISLLVLIYFMLYSSIFWLLLYFEKKKSLSEDPKPKRFPLVSIVIPVYKGDKKEVIKKAISSALSLSYPKKEIILSWNGPKTDAYKLCEKLANENKNVKLVYTPKKGKAAGMNEALKHIKGELFCCLDADSFFHKDALEHMVGYFEDPKIGAVTSSMKVFNPKTIVQKIQWVEYIFAIYLRKLSSLIDCLYVVPGPGSMYRTETIKKIGGFDENNLTEDMEIAFRLLDNGYKIKNSLNAFVDTIAPSKFIGLLKQRIRWYTGFYDNVKLYRHMLFNPKAGMLGIFMLPLSIVWVGIILYSIAILIKSVVTKAVFDLTILSIIGLDLDVLISIIKRTLVFQPTYLTWFAFVLSFIGIYVIYLGLKMSKEKAEVTHKYPHYITYLLFYSILVGVFWISTLGYIVARSKLKYRLW